MYELVVSNKNSQRVEKNFVFKLSLNYHTHKCSIVTASVTVIHFTCLKYITKLVVILLAKIASNYQYFYAADNYQYLPAAGLYQYLPAAGNYQYIPDLSQV